MKYYTVTIFSNKGSSGFPANDDRYKSEGGARAVALAELAQRAPGTPDALTRDGDGVTVDLRDDADGDFIETIADYQWRYDWHGGEDDRAWAMCSGGEPVNSDRIA